MNECDLFIAALDKPTLKERQEFLEEACGGNQDLRRRVESLLASHSQAGSLLEHPALDRDATVATSQSDVSTSGEGTSIAASRRDDIQLDFLTPVEEGNGLGRLASYRVTGVIGRGGMGVVLKAHDAKLNRTVAIKVLAPELASSALARQRFIREAQAAAAVVHPHVVTIHAVDDVPLPHLVMEFIDGLSLQDKIDRQGPLPLVEILRIGSQVALGLRAAHAQGLVHRDIKPANILLDCGEGQVKITDFGLAYAVGDERATHPGTVIGTPHYMSPEQAMGQGVDQRSDLFSLGSVLYAMCTGRSPFRADSTVAALRRVCDDTPQPVREINPDIPEWLCQLIERLLAKNPAERLQTAAEVAELLGRPPNSEFRIQNSELSSAARSWRTDPKSQIQDLKFAAVALVGLLLAACGVWVIIKNKYGKETARVEVPDGGSAVIETDSRPKTASPTAPQSESSAEAKPKPAIASEREAFVVLGGPGVAERKFDSLGDAVLSASAGDTIEVRGSGPYQQGQLSIKGRAVRIRAGEGFRPIFHLSPPESPRGGRGMIDSDSTLILEGLEFQQIKQDATKLPSNFMHWYSIAVHQAPLFMANCRIVAPSGVSGGLLNADGSHRCEICNCQLSGVSGLASFYAAENRTVLRNNLILIRGRSGGDGFGPGANANIQLKRNTFVGTGLKYTYNPQGLPDPVAGAPKLLRLEASGNIFDVNDVPLHLGLSLAKPAEKPAELVQRLVSWKGDHNLFSPSALRLTTQNVSVPAVASTGLAEWRQFWSNAETNSVEGRSPHFLRSDFRDLAYSAPEQLEPKDLRLHPDSAGHAAGPRGEDLGADVDLVGPGPAYERFKQTQAYQQWLKDIGQIIPRAVNQPFVISAHLGGTEQGFATLALAVAAAQSGDTIDIRGNGPFLIAPIDVGAKSLVIRAGRGFQPLLKGRPDKWGAAEVTSKAHLVLEGLDVWMSDEALPRSSEAKSFPACFSASPLSIVNCRGQAIRGQLFMGDIARAVNNLVIYGAGASYPPWARGSHRLENNVLVGYGPVTITRRTEIQYSGSMDLDMRRNTFVGTIAVNAYLHGPLPDPLEFPEFVRIVSRENVFSCPFGLSFYREPHSSDKEDFTQPDNQRRLLVGLAGWQENGSLFHNRRFPNVVFGSPSTKAALKLSISSGSLDGWQDVWPISKSDYRSGDVVFASPQLNGTNRDIGTVTFTPEDFRLRPESSGYRAAPDGKDLGADIDFVGPGPAYERFKQSPAYQQWLKDGTEIERNENGR